MKVITGVLGIVSVIWSLPICYWVNKNYIRHNLIIALGVIGFVAGFYLIWKCIIRNGEGRNECT